MSLLDEMQSKYSKSDVASNTENQPTQGVSLLDEMQQKYGNQDASEFPGMHVVSHFEKPAVPPLSVGVPRTAGDLPEYLPKSVDPANTDWLTKMPAGERSLGAAVEGLAGGVTGMLRAGAHTALAPLYYAEKAGDYVARKLGRVPMAPTPIVAAYERLAGPSQGEQQMRKDVDAVSQHEVQEFGVPAATMTQIGRTVFQSAMENALILAGAGGLAATEAGAIPALTVKESVKEAIPMAAKFGGFTYATTDGDVAAKTKAALKNTAFMMSPAFMGGIPKPLLAKVAATMVNVGLDVPEWRETVKNAKEEAARTGKTTASVIMESVVPSVIMAGIFGSQAHSLKPLRDSLAASDTRLRAFDAYQAEQERTRRTMQANAAMPAEKGGPSTMPQAAPAAEKVPTPEPVETPAPTPIQTPGKGQIAEKGKEAVVTPAAKKPEEMTPEEQRASSNTAELDAAHRLKKPIKGKTGAEIVGYQWMSTVEDGMYGDRRVSDWSGAQTSVPTGRQIVHLFWVRTPDGQETLMGVGAAKKALGFNEQRLYSIAKQEQEAQAYRAKQEAEELKGIESIAVDSTAEAAKLHRKNTYSPMRSEGENERLFRDSVLLTKNGKFLRAGPSRQALMTANGWKLVADDPMKRASSPAPEQKLSLKVGDRIPWKNSPDPNENVKEIEVVKLGPTVATVRWVGGSELQRLPRAAVEARLKPAAPAPSEKEGANSPKISPPTATRPTEQTKQGVTATGKKGQATPGGELSVEQAAEQGAKITVPREATHVEVTYKGGKTAKVTRDSLDTLKDTGAIKKLVAVNRKGDPVGKLKVTAVKSKVDLEAQLGLKKKGEKPSRFSAIKDANKAVANGDVEDVSLDTVQQEAKDASARYNNADPYPEKRDKSDLRVAETSERQIRSDYGQSVIPSGDSPNAERLARPYVQYDAKAAGTTGIAEARSEAPAKPEPAPVKVESTAEDLFPEAKGKAPTLERVRRAVDEATVEAEKENVANDALESGEESSDKANQRLERLQALQAKMESAEIEKAKTSVKTPEAPKPDITTKARGLKGSVGAAAANTGIQRPDGFVPGMGPGSPLAKGAKPLTHSGDFGNDSQSKQLADAVSEAAKKPVSATERVRSAIKQVTDSAKRMRETNLKDAASQKVTTAKEGIDRVRAVGATLWDSLTHLPPVTEGKKIIGEFLGTNQEIDYNAREMAKALRKAVPDATKREGITAWIQADGDADLLRLWADKSTGKAKNGYEAALKLTEEEQTIAKNIGQYYEAKLQEGIETDFLTHGIENYVNQIWLKENPITQKLVASGRTGVLNENPGITKKRVFGTFFDGEQAGFKPVTKDIAQLTAIYDQTFNRALNARLSLKRLMDATASDGNPLIVMSGRATQIGEGEYEATGKPGPLLVFPKAKPEVTQTVPYRTLDRPELRNWKWVNTDEAGRSTLMESDALIHPEAYDQLRAILEPSAIRKNNILRGILKAQSVSKQTLFSLSPFHQVTEIEHALGHLVNPANLKTLDFRDAGQKELVNHGLKVASFDAWNDFENGYYGGGLVKYIPGVGKLQSLYTEWLFSSFIPRIKMTMALDAMDRNMGRYAKELKTGKLTRDQVAELTARQSNSAFGELNTEYMGRSKTTQDVLRLFLIAPDFLEARARFAGQSVKPYGREQLRALTIIAATQYIGARILNKLLDDDYHFEPSNMFSVIHKGRRYSLRTVPGDIEEAITDFRRFAYNRVSPFLGASVEALTGRDYRGEQRTEIEQGLDFARRNVPMSLRKNTDDQTILQSILNASGVRNKPFFTKAQEEAHAARAANMPGEFIYSPSKDPNRQIKEDLRRGEVTIDEAVRSGRMTGRQAKYAKQNESIKLILGLPLKDAQKVYADMTPEQQTEAKKTMERKEANARRNIGHTIVTTRPTRKTQ